jgi:hypothetical protein
MTTATLHLEVLDHCVHCALDGGGWSYSARVFPGESAYDIPYERMTALGTGEHRVEVDLHVRPVEVKHPSRGKDQDSIDWLRYEFFQERVGLVNSSWLLSSIVFAFNPRTAQEITALLPKHHLNEVREYASRIPRTWIMRRLRPMYWSVVKTEGKLLVPEENLVALRKHFPDETAA